MHFLTVKAIANDLPQTHTRLQWSPNPVKLGQSATVKCGASGTGEIGVQWYHENVPIQQNDSRFTIETIEGKSLFDFSQTKNI